MFVTIEITHNLKGWIEMKVLIVGANGQIGKHLVQLIQNSETIKAKAMIRKAEQAKFFEDLGVETVLVDLEDEITKITEATKDVDAVVFAAGSGPSTGVDKTMLIDLDGAVKTIEATKDAGVKRFILISSYETSRETIQEAVKESPSFAPYVVAKHYADDWLRKTDLDYTIIHPGSLTNDEATGKVEAAETVKPNGIPREDVAEVLLTCLENEATIGKEFQVVTGEDPIKKAIQSL